MLTGGLPDLSSTMSIYLHFGSSINQALHLRMGGTSIDTTGYLEALTIPISKPQVPSLNGSTSCYVNTGIAYITTTFQITLQSPFQTRSKFVGEWRSSNLVLFEVARKASC